MNPTDNFPGPQVPAPSGRSGDKVRKRGKKRKKEKRLVTIHTSSHGQERHGDFPKKIEMAFSQQDLYYLPDISSGSGWKFDDNLVEYVVQKAQEKSPDPHVQVIMLGVVLEYYCSNELFS